VRELTLRSHRRRVIISTEGREVKETKTFDYIENFRQGLALVSWVMKYFIN
jgi:hypothetical protein